MVSIDDLARWIADNNGLLSGLVSLVALVGFVLSPLGKGLRSLSSRGREHPKPPRPQAPPPHLAGSTAASEPLLAVLAFDNLSSDGEM